MVTLSGGPMTLLVHVHAALSTGWVLLFVGQTTLVGRHKVAIPRRMGVAGTVLAVLMLIVGMLTALKVAARGAAPGGIDPLSLLMIPLSNMFFFWRLAMRAA